MAEMAEPTDINREKIINRIQDHEHRVLTTGEISEAIPREPKSVRLNLKWMVGHDILEGRRTTGGSSGSTWIWWIDPTELSTAESIVSARQVRTHLRELYDSRWEFRLMAVGAGLIMIVFSLTFWLVVLREFGFYQLSGTSILALMGTGLLLAIMIVFTGLFIFPYETAGNWAAAMEADEDEKSD